MSGKPAWLRVERATREPYAAVARAVREHALHTVCSEARCPNRVECWSRGTATFLILGDVCTRGCAFCAVRRGRPAAPDEGEPLRVRLAAQRMGLTYAVVTSVTRDDLPDGGAAVFAATLHALKQFPDMRVEVLTPDFLGDALSTVLRAAPDVFAHNLETVERLTPRLRHPRFSFAGSLATLEAAKRLCPAVPAKSSLLLGLGETEEEVRHALNALRGVGVDFLALGQYLSPGANHAPVASYLTPETFAHYRDMAEELGFQAVAAAPLVRTSYRAAEFFRQRSNPSPVSSRHETSF